MNKNNHFKVSKVTDLSNASVGDIIPCSDFTCVSGDKLVQLEYIEEETKEYQPVKPGLYSIQDRMNVMYLEPTKFSEETLLESFVQTQKITYAVNRFFNKLYVYKKRGKAVPARNILIWGPPGTGKSSAISQALKTYIQDGKSAVLLWYTDQHGADDIKEFIKSFKYEGVERLIVVAEDIGGVEVEQAKMNSLPSLLSLLDNKEMIFTVPTMIIGTTNFPESLLGNITNRPGRFSDKIHLDYPDGESRKELLKFYLKEKATPELLDKIAGKKFKEFSAAHIEEIDFRAELDDMSVSAAIDSIQKEIEEYNKMFTQKSTIGFEV